MPPYASTGMPREELIGTDVRRLLHPEDMRRFERAQCRVLEGPQRGPVWRHRTKQGRDILVSVATHIIDFEGQKAQMVFADDVTEHRTATLRARQAERRLRTALTQTIKVLLSASGQRDAYTAEHQSRVGDITVAIAKEMRLPSDLIEGLRFGAMVHDIGKLGVPAELLSLPRRLKPEEFALVKMHAQIGYEIVKELDHPWPIGKVVLQHHERLDGSGYPNQLRGEEICIEARVLAVADAIEAMASHRPYRAGDRRRACVGDSAGGSRHQIRHRRGCRLHDPAQARRLTTAARALKRPSRRGAQPGTARGARGDLETTRRVPDGRNGTPGRGGSPSRGNPGRVAVIRLSPQAASAATV